MAERLLLNQIRYRLKIGKAREGKGGGKKGGGWHH